MSEIVYNGCSKYQIDGIEIEIISENISDDVCNTYYSIDNFVYCIGDEPDDIQAAIVAYEHFFNIKLSEEKLSNLYHSYLEKISNL